MSIPTPPTDNLYKFLALSGLVLYLFSLSYPFIASKQLDREIDQVTEEITVLEIEVINFETEIKIFDKEIQSLAKDIEDLEALDDTLLTEEDREWRKKNMAEKKEQLLDLMMRTGEIGKRVALAEVKNERLKRLLTEVRVIRILGVVGTCLGGAIAIVGFMLWYFRVQIYLDRKLQKEAGIIDDSKKEKEE